MTILLTGIVKSTPDYLPLYGEDQRNKYDRYAEEILEGQTGFEKRFEGSELVLEWTSQTTEKTAVPVIKYKDTRLVLNGKGLTDFAISLISIDKVTLQSRPGKNQLHLSYPMPRMVFIGLLVTGMTWLGLLWALWFRS